MKTSSTSARSVPLDFLRGLAILLVLGIHYDPPAPTGALRGLWGFFKVYGGAGVDLFFVLSGFLVGGLLMNEHVKRGTIGVGRFLSRRGLKIWPQYYVFVLVSMALGIAHRDWSRVGSEVPNLLHLQNYLGTPHLHTWSLAVEEHFYLVLVAVLGFLSARKALDLRRVGYVFLGAFAIATFSRLYYTFVVHASAGETLRFTNSRIDTLALGVLLAAVFHFQKPQFDRLAAQRLPLLATFVAAMVGLWAVNGNPPVFETLGYALRALASVCLLILVYGAPYGVGLLGKAQGLAAYRGLAWIGQSSYGIYLWHLAVARGPSSRVYGVLAGKLPTDLAWALGFVFWCALASVAGYVVTRLVEVPFLRLRERKLASSVPPPEFARLEGQPPERSGPLVEIAEEPRPAVEASAGRSF